MGIWRYASMPQVAIFSAGICLDSAKFSHRDSDLSASRYRINVHTRRAKHRNRRRDKALILPTSLKNEQESRETTRPSMTAQQYLLSQAEHCRRTADDSSDPFVAEELRRLAAEFERRARQFSVGREKAPPQAA